MWRDLVFQRMLSDYRGGLVRRPDEIRSRRNNFVSLRIVIYTDRDIIYIYMDMSDGTVRQTEIFIFKY
ncbi:hypothetical protein BDA96_05G166200 [Sorghum bicolor]|uniref:Uncharacterized protein n=2 Tax=Sorghum bicolor TaxID=4558 RepID=A0A921UG18_SORBI|nr:hypothetical protein BDA96_05G166200 [Sorghum bicolor]KXG28679.1 hypothetical protein SORBI_3005G152300 [Sorghum bicolor]